MMGNKILEFNYYDCLLSYFLLKAFTSIYLYLIDGPEKKLQAKKKLTLNFEIFNLKIVKICGAIWGKDSRFVNAWTHISTCSSIIQCFTVRVFEQREINYMQDEMNCVVCGSRGFVLVIQLKPSWATNKVNKHLNVATV